MNNKNFPLNLDYHSRTPIYEQIINQIERYIVLGILTPNTQLPSIRELASTLGINPNTVRKAYLELDKRQIISTISAKGTYINESIAFLTKERTKKHFEIIMQNIDELKKLGLSPSEIEDNIKKYLK